MNKVIVIRALIVFFCLGAIALAVPGLVGTDAVKLYETESRTSTETTKTEYGLWQVCSTVTGRAKSCAGASTIYRKDHIFPTCTKSYQTVGARWGATAAFVILGILTSLITIALVLLCRNSFAIILAISGCCFLTVLSFGIACAIYIPTLLNWYFCGKRYCTAFRTTDTVACKEKFSLGSILFLVACGCALVALILSLIHCAVSPRSSQTPAAAASKGAPSALPPTAPTPMPTRPIPTQQPQPIAPPTVRQNTPVGRPITTAGDSSSNTNMTRPAHTPTGRRNPTPPHAARRHSGTSTPITDKAPPAPKGRPGPSPVPMHQPPVQKVKTPPPAAVAYIEKTEDAPMDPVYKLAEGEVDDWVLDEDSGLWWSDTAQYYLHVESGHFYDPSTGWWCDPDGNWYEDPEAGKPEFRM